jgi:quercetin dioxygenase-like cupin family protein
MGVIHRRSSDGWEGVEPRAYDDQGLADVEQRELIGEADGARHYRVRHFRVPSGGATARERHPHDHGVMILSGRARVTLARFEACGGQALEFLCVAPPRAR